MMQKLKQLIGLPTLLFSAMLMLFAGCGDKNNEEGAKPSLVQIEAETVNYYITTNRIATQGPRGLTYVATIVDPESTTWCSFDLFTPSGAAVTEKSGAVGSSIFLTLKKNMTPQNRTATIQVTLSDNYTTTVTMTQLAYSVTALYDRAWGEQPAFREEDNYIYKTYFTTFANNAVVRNYSVCFGLDKRVSYWVAYPIHSSYTRYSGYKYGGSSQGRTDAWAYDDTQTEYSATQNSFNRGYYTDLGRKITEPAIAENDQQYIIRGYGAGSYQRGHMLPSASRLVTWSSNAQTCYATNLMPQNGTFNGGVWAQLEGKERSWAGSGTNDTLFVVTGTLFKNSTTISNSNGPVAVPSHCWKVMLRVRRGSGALQIGQCSADELKSIGFIFSNDAAGAATSVQDAARTVHEIEQQTGFTFFRNLAPGVAEAVKNQNNRADWNGL